MQPIDEIEKEYEREDPWGFKTNKSDLIRKHLIINCLESRYPQFDRALDIGCGEGWVTKDLPAKEKYGNEVSKNARARFPKDVKECEVPRGKYDLVITTGTLYEHYDWRNMCRLIEQHSSKVILICNIKGWEVYKNDQPRMFESIFKAKQVFNYQFDYRNYKQQMRVFEK